MQNVEQNTNAFTEMAALLNSIETNRDLRTKAAHDLEQALNRAADAIAAVFEGKELNDCLNADFHETYDERDIDDGQGTEYDVLYFQRERVFVSEVEIVLKPVLTIANFTYKHGFESEKTTYNCAFTGAQDYNILERKIIQDKSPRKFEYAKARDVIVFDEKKWLVTENWAEEIKAERYAAMPFGKTDRAEMVKIAKALPRYVKRLNNYVARTLHETVEATATVEPKN